MIKTGPAFYEEKDREFRDLFTEGAPFLAEVCVIVFPFDRINERAKVSILNVVFYIVREKGTLQKQGEYLRWKVMAAIAKDGFELEACMPNFAEEFAKPGTITVRMVE